MVQTSDAVLPVRTIRSTGIEGPEKGAEGEPQGNPRRGAVPQGPIQRLLEGTEDGHPGITSHQGTGEGLAPIQGSTVSTEGSPLGTQGGIVPEAERPASPYRDILLAARQRLSPIFDFPVTSLEVRARGFEIRGTQGEPLRNLREGMQMAFQHHSQQQELVRQQAAQPAANPVLTAVHPAPPAQPVSRDISQMSVEEIHAYLASRTTFSSATAAVAAPSSNVAAQPELNVASAAPATVPASVPSGVHVPNVVPLLSNVPVSTPTVAVTPAPATTRREQRNHVSQ